MTAKTTRLLKEARPLLLPWCAVTVAALLPLVNRRDFTFSISMIGFWAGIPLLATLALGNEFQYRTLPLLLAQPVGRMEVWREKLRVTAVAVLSTVLVFFLVWRAVPNELDPQAFPFLGAWILGIFASATFWTLFTRSTLGGVVLNVGIHTFVILTTWNHFVGPLNEPGNLSKVNASIVPILGLVFLCYAGAMFWLGGRKLARFQVTGGMAGDDLLMAGPDVLPGALAEWFRCRPTGTVLNLIRKELRLLRPLWLITLLAIAGWTCLTMFGFVPKHGSTTMPSAVAAATFGMGIISTLILAVLAGSLSLGEERTSGTHAWHLTLPVSVRSQWLVKLLMALLAGVVCAALLPELVLIAGGLLFGSPFKFLDLPIGMVWLLIVLLLSFASFWCACALNGTVRAATWVFPVMIAFSLAAAFGVWLGIGLTRMLLSRFDFFTTFWFTNAVSNMNYVQYLSGEGTDFKVTVANLMNSAGTRSSLVDAMLIVWIPTLLVAVIQSYRLFRKQAQDSISSVFRNLLPIAAMAFLCSFSLFAFDALVGHAQRQMWTMFHETQEAIEMVKPGTPNLDAAHPLELTGEDLAKVAPLSERTRRWLCNSRITVAPNPPYFHPCCRLIDDWVPYPSEKTDTGFLATIHLTDGPVCTVLFSVGTTHQMGYLGGVCK